MDDAFVEFLDALEARGFLEPTRKLVGEHYDGYMSAALMCWNYEKERGHGGFWCNPGLLRAMAEFRGDRAIGACRFAEFVTGDRPAKVMAEAHRKGKSLGFYEAFGVFYINE
jgi:hypothetical protein